MTDKQTAPKNNLIEKKPEMGTIPLDILRDFLVPAYQEGFKKYGRESWRQGFLLTDMMDAALRHLASFFHDCEDYDPEPMEKYGIEKHHLGAALFCLLCMCDTMKNHPDLDNRPYIIKQKSKYDE